MAKKPLPVLSLILSDSYQWNQWDKRPMECCYCPFATPSYKRDPVNFYPPNSADPGEGHYDCAPLEKEAVWGEQPKCGEEIWKTALRDELASVGISSSANYPCNLEMEMKDDAK